MVAVKPVVVKYGAYLGFAFILWLLPTGANLPPLFAIVCLISAIIAFVYAALEGKKLSSVLTKARMQQRAADELDQHTLAARTHYAMEAVTREAELEFAPVAMMTASSPVHALPPSQPAQFDPETQIFVDQLIELSKEVGWLTPSLVKRRRKGFRPFSPEQIREFFQDLANVGVGRVKGEGASLEWISE